MKLLLSVSVLLNLAISGHSFWLWHAASSRESTASGEIAESADSSQTSVIMEPQGPDPSIDEGPEEAVARPAALSGGSMDIATRLIEAGWSPEEATAFALGKLLKDYADGLIDERNQRSFWVSKTWEEYEADRKEREKVLRSMEHLLGLDGVGVSELASIPIQPEKALAAARVHHQYSMAALPFQEDLLLPEDYEARDRLEAERRAKLAELLTPEELFEFELRASASADHIRRMFDGVALTEEQFRAVFALQYDLDRVHDPRKNPYLNDAIPMSYLNAEGEMDRKVAAILDEDQLAQYKRAQRPSYSRIVNFTERMKIPQENARLAADLFTSTTNRYREMRRAGISDEEAAGVEAEVRTKLRTLFGEENLKQYEQTFDGRWVNYRSR